MPGFTERTFTNEGAAPAFGSAAGRGLLTALALASGLAATALAPPARVEPLPAPALVVDVNHVPLEVLSALPGVGPALAREIDDRRVEAPFISLSDLARRTRGVGPATLARLAPHIRTGAQVAARFRPDR